MIPYEEVLATKLPVQEYRYSERDAILYALGVGYGYGKEEELPFIYERDLRVVPTMTGVMAFNIDWASAIGVDILRFVHGHQSIVLHAPLPRRGAIVSQSRIVDVFDKGREKGAVILLETEMRDKATGVLLCTKRSSSYARGDGGGGGSAAPAPAPHVLPQRTADFVDEVQIAANQALIFRLLGDSHPLHVDPAFARMAGFPRPIVHGLCTLGVACRLVIARFCGQRPERIRQFEGRFTAPVYPGETLLFELWKEGATVSFRATATRNNAVVLDNGMAVIDLAGAPAAHPDRSRTLTSGLA